MVFLGAVTEVQTEDINPDAGEFLHLFGRAASGAERGDDAGMTGTDHRASCNRDGAPRAVDAASLAHYADVCMTQIPAKISPSLAVPWVTPSIPRTDGL